MRIVAFSLAVVKFLIALPCILCGLVTGVMGMCPGPEGFFSSPFLVRLIGLSVFIGGLAVLYPFSLTRRRARVDRLIVMLSLTPAGVLTAWMGLSHFPQIVGVIALSLLLPVLAIEDLLLSNKLHRRVESEGQKTGVETGELKRGRS